MTWANPVSPSEPQAGFYKARMVRGGPWTAIKIWHGPTLDPETREPLDRSHRWQATRNGVEIDVWQLWPGCSGRPITEGEYDRMIWANLDAVLGDNDPLADPTRSIDISKTRPAF